MTRTFDGRVTCPYCKRTHTQETALERWIRDCRELDSRRNGLVRFDCDILLHRYMLPADKKGTRLLQCIMFIEAKTHSGQLTLAQQDTLSMFNQVLRNRRRNIHRDKKGRHAQDHCPPCKCYSFANKMDVRLWMFGGHLLQLSGNDPEDSEVIKWDFKEIDVTTLIRIFRFELDPDDIEREIDWRRRYSAFRRAASQPLLFA